MSSKSSKSRSEAAVPEAVVIGRVRKPHGVRGEIVVEILSDVPDRFCRGAEIIVNLASGGRSEVTIESVALGTSTARIRFTGFEDRDAVEPLRGALLEIPRDRVPNAPDGQYYFFELIGCRCRDSKEGDLGEVVDVIEDGGGLLLKISAANRGLLVPFVRSYIENIDISNRQIDVDLPEGLTETCGFK